MVCPHGSNHSLEGGGGRLVWVCVSSHDLWWQQCLLSEFVSCKVCVMAYLSLAAMPNVHAYGQWWCWCRHSGFGSRGVHVWSGLTIDIYVANGDAFLIKYIFKGNNIISI